MSSGPFAEESRGTYRTIPTDDEQTLAHNVEDPAAPSQAESRQASSSRLQRLRYVPVRLHVHSAFPYIFRPNALGLTEDPPHPSVLPPTPLPAQFPETDRQQNVEMLGVDDGSPAPVGSAQTQVSVLPNPSEKSPTHSSAIPSSRKASSGARPDPNMQSREQIATVNFLLIVLQISIQWTGRYVAILQSGKHMSKKRGKATSP